MAHAGRELSFAPPFKNSKALGTGFGQGAREGNDWNLKAGGFSALSEAPWLLLF